MKRHDNARKELTDEAFSAAMENPTDDLVEIYGDEILRRAFLRLPDIKALSFLCMAAKKAKARDFIVQLLQAEGMGVILSGLSSDSPKMRKNTARLIGALLLKECDDALICALSCEKVRMVRPSMILSLGSLGTEKAHDFLRKYEPVPAKDETEIKHFHEESDALSKALSNFGADERHVFRDFDGINEIQLICAASLGKYVAEDCRRTNLTVRSYGPSSVTISGDKKEKIYTVRSFRELAIPVGNTGDALIRSKTLKVLDILHEKSNFPYRYRIEYRGEDDRRAEIKKAISLFECERMKNSPSDYEVELRIYADGRVSLIPFTCTDKRFAYRKAAVSASISPANAAACMSYARGFLTENAVVLDLCCGSGTMLFERDLFLPCKELYGCDISGKAVSAARENARDFGKKAHFIHTDLRKLHLDFRVDEIISNLPFGNRVGTHAENERLYEDIFGKAAEVLRLGGMMMLYTMERNLLHKTLKKSGDFEFVSEIKTEAGGLFPALIILKRT